MKKYLVLLIACALACAFTFASGNDNGENMIVKFQKGDIAKTVIVRLANLEKLPTEVGVLGADGIFWYSKFILWKNGYATEFNLNEMPEGDYVLYVSNKKGAWVQTFNISFNDIAFFDKMPASSDTKGVATLVSLVEFEKGKLIAKFIDNGGLKFSVRMANLRKQPASIELVSLDKGAVFSKTVTNEDGYAIMIDLVGASNGSYFLYLHAADATVVQFLSITNNNDIMLGEIQRLERPIDIKLLDAVHDVILSSK